MEENKKTNSETVETKENLAAENGKLQTDEQLEDVAGGDRYTGYYPISKATGTYKGLA